MYITFGSWLLLTHSLLAVDPAGIDDGLVPSAAELIDLNAPATSAATDSATDMPALTLSPPTIDHQKICPPGTMKEEQRCPYYYTDKRISRTITVVCFGIRSFVDAKGRSHNRRTRKTYRVPCPARYVCEPLHPRSNDGACYSRAAAPYRVHCVPGKALTREMQFIQELEDQGIFTRYPKRPRIDQGTRVVTAEAASASAGEAASVSAQAPASTTTATERITLHDFDLNHNLFDNTCGR